MIRMGSQKKEGMHVTVAHHDIGVVRGYQSSFFFRAVGKLMERYLYCIAICADGCVEPAFGLSNVPLGRRSRRATVWIPNGRHCDQFDEITNVTVVVAARRVI